MGNSETFDLIFRAVDVPETRDQVNSLGRSVHKMGDESLWAGRQSERSFGLMTKGIRGLAGLFGISGVAFGVKDLVVAGENLQKNQLMLQRALRGTGDAGKAAFNKIDEAAIKSSESGGFGRDEELQSLTQLINTAKKVPGVMNPVNLAMRANQAAINLARADSISYTSAQHYMNQALVGNVNRLKQYVGYILPVTKAQQALVNRQKEIQAQLSLSKMPTYEKDQLKIQLQTTKQMEQQALMQDKLTTGQEIINRLNTGKGFKGAQAAFAGTTQGRLEILKNTFDEVMGSIGQAMLPAVNTVLRDVGGFIKLLSDAKPVVDALGVAVTALGVVAFGKMLHHGLEYFYDDMKSNIETLGNYKRQYSLTGKKIMVANADEVDSLKILQKQQEANTVALEEYANAQKELAQLSMMVSKQYWVNAKGQIKEASATRIARGEAMSYSAAIKEQAVWLERENGAMTEAIALARGDAAAQAEVAGMTEVAAKQTGIMALAQRGQAVASTVAGAATGFAATAVDMLAMSIRMIPGILIFSAITMAMMHMGSIVTWVKNAFVDAYKWISHAWGHLPLVVQLFISPLLTVITHLKQIIHFAGMVGHAIGSAFGGIGHFIGSIFNEGGPVHKTPKYLATGGPIGTDTVPAWLTPGEGVLSRQAMNMIGERGLNLLNSGMNPFGMGGGGPIVIEPGVVNVQLDARTIARAIVQFTLNKAARGPSSLSGGSLATGRA